MRWRGRVRDCWQDFFLLALFADRACFESGESNAMAFDETVLVQWTIYKACLEFLFLILPLARLPPSSPPTLPKRPSQALPGSPEVGHLTSCCSEVAKRIRTEYLLLLDYKGANFRILCLEFQISSRQFLFLILGFLCGTRPLSLIRYVLMCRFLFTVCVESGGVTPCFTAASLAETLI